MFDDGCVQTFSDLDMFVLFYGYLLLFLCLWSSKRVCKSTLGTPFIVLITQHK
jgi:hypothetical protein